ncbi:uncharacterized protein CIMG_11383 [Coccidioides immitis RS]|uniref:Uncharacterized protein n=1 Tax=Coccidioides immitis (strain RS) TaxID=246410 RepID=A0A0D8JV45_COCIM|nr:uncharacterized protein CIMG_11383 [Coccidioides immitis RS]KJF61029.1 hypothetical protein CIMG_11383 [Coccidioides immitis RS]
MSSRRPPGVKAEETLLSQICMAQLTSRSFCILNFISHAGPSMRGIKQSNAICPVPDHCVEQSL